MSITVDPPQSIVQDPTLGDMAKSNYDPNADGKIAFMQMLIANYLSLGDIQCEETLDTAYEQKAYDGTLYSTSSTTWVTLKDFGSITTPDITKEQLVKVKYQLNHGGAYPAYSFVRLLEDGVEKWSDNHNSSSILTRSVEFRTTGGTHTYKSEMKISDSAYTSSYDEQYIYMRKVTPRLKVV